ncbi:MAG: guanylate kinase [Holophagales bacterium]|nr:MAG: guanylate kinase [Holophagales bacterium]
MPRGDLFLISAPSGGGKTTLMKALEEKLGAASNLAFVVSHTTRRPRAGELPGVDYHFVDDQTFDRMLEDGEFLEWAPVHGHRYGTAAMEVVPLLERGLDVIHDLDVQGTERLVQSLPEAHTVFVLPPSYAELARRLSARAADPPAEILVRLGVSLSEIERYERYDYVIINRDLATAVEALVGIVLEKRHRRVRMREAAESILADFRAKLRSDSAG